MKYWLTDKINDAFEWADYGTAFLDRYLPVSRCLECLVMLVGIVLTVLCRAALVAFLLPLMIPIAILGYAMKRFK